MARRAPALALAGLLALGAVSGCSEAEQAEVEEQVEKGGNEVGEQVEKGGNEIQEQVEEGAEEGDEGG